MTDAIPTTEPALAAVGQAECWQLLAGADVGRFAVVAGDGVDIFPVNFLVKNDVIYFASAPGSKLIDLTLNPQVAFEADGIADRRRWSVVVKGTATRLGFDTEIEESGVKELHSMAPTEKWNYVRIDPQVITGRRFTASRTAN